MIRDSKARLGVVATQCNARVEILLSHLSKFVPTQEFNSTRTFRGSKFCSISENPVANAIGRRAESDLARCSASVSARKIKNRAARCGVTYTKALPSHWPGHNKPTLGQKRGWRTINFAISAFMVLRKSPAVGCEIL